MCSLTPSHNADAAPHTKIPWNLEYSIPAVAH
jgi:hypothetical protein